MICAVCDRCGEIIKKNVLADNNIDYITNGFSIRVYKAKCESKNVYKKRVQICKECMIELIKNYKNKKKGGIK